MVSSLHFKWNLRDRICILVFAIVILEEKNYDIYVCNFAKIALFFDKDYDKHDETNYVTWNVN